MQRSILGLAIALSLAGSGLSQTATAPPQVATFNGSTRGYWFTAPVDFTITGVQVELQTGSANTFQNFAILHFDGNVPPPNFAATTNAFSQLALGLDLAQGVFQPVNVPVQAGDVIGIYGNTTAAAGTTTGSNSYGNGSVGTMISGNAVTLNRSGMQFHLGSATSPGGMHDVWSEPASTNVTRVSFTYTRPTATTNFCTAKTALTCGTAAISATGTASATAPLGFVVTAAPARDDRRGILLYNNMGTVPGVSFQGGTLCLPANGLRRAGPTNSMGSCPPAPIGCAGAFSIDMNTFAQGLWMVPDCAGVPPQGPSYAPAAFLLAMGTTIDAQYWGRDMMAPNGAYVSDGITWVQGP
jgi:hypothetical protein